MTTPYHTKYWAHELTLRRATGTIESISRSIAGARVDLNPHQIDAALFAVRSPLTKGVILADEVGLGKTIEAGIVIAQKWAERRRRILLIVPATLRTQWQQELESKFYLPTTIIDSRVYNECVETRPSNPFEMADRLVICSYHFASAKSQEIARVTWDLAVVDEAHRLRNVYRKSSKLARSIVDAIAHVPKLLVTATPLQNSLMELYGLASVIDDHLFGDQTSFRDQFIRATDERARNAALKERVRPVCIRTLRRQVVEYIPFTRRVPITQDFRPTDDEQALYELISAYLQRESLIALPTSQRTLITLILRKLLASSTFAIATTLGRLCARLEALSSQHGIILDDEDLEGVDELIEELEEATDGDEQSSGGPPFDPAKMRGELTELRDFAGKARTISTNAKGEALIPALNVAFERAVALGAQRKAVVFTESRRTQEYLFELLTSRGYLDQVVMMNGSNSDPHSRTIYDRWRERHSGQEIVTGSRSVDIKTAIVEHFRDQATILVATEAAAEGVNLQFCSLVVNYDLPWNPQRIEQRIGRCHRYGQKHDVVVVNFLNRRNEADQRVLELLGEKFRLFDGVFGASDEVLGVLESGVDIERRIAQVYQTCRSTEEIRTAFDHLRAELEEQIQARLAQTREMLLENFDEEVSARLRVHRDRTIETLSQRERYLLDLTRTELHGTAQFDRDKPRFRYSGPHGNPGWYNFDWRDAERNGDVFYRQDHPLAAHIIQEAIGRELAPVALQLSYPGHRQVVSILRPLVGEAGWLEVSKLTVESLDTEEFLLFAARTDSGSVLDEEASRKLLLLPARIVSPPAAPATELSSIRDEAARAKVHLVEERNTEFFEEEARKLDRWSDDLKQGLEREIKELDRQIREARRAAVLAGSLQSKLEAQKSLKSLEGTRNRKRRELFDAQDAIDAQRDSLINSLVSMMHRRLRTDPLFCLRWTLIP